MFCERKEKMIQKGIDYTKYCKCKENGQECTVIADLNKAVEWLAGCCTYPYKD